ncbi:acyl-CoA-binding domain-containing protein 6 isoform X2 [Candoia aspera]|uniref:acyl-CoA-binding domain-containing protein 6 isoform X2 n=1 Tax=Candoia aspera TaxID=51853 RepID=UPI002FD838C6
MASLFPAKGVRRTDRGDDCSSGEEERAAAAVMVVGGLGESPGPGSESESRSSSPLNLTEQFERAAQRVPTLVAAASKEQLLYLYARYKQVKCGSCNIPKPGFFDFEGKQKWEAWKALGETSLEQAMREYIDTVKKLDPTWNPQISEKKGKEGKAVFGGPVVSSLYQEETIREELCCTGHVIEDIKNLLQYFSNTLLMLIARMMKVKQHCIMPLPVNFLILWNCCCNLELTLLFGIQKDTCLRR